MTESINPPKAEELLEVRSSDYVPQGYYGHYYITRHRPYFSMITIRDMLTDPRVIFGLWLIKGPIVTNARFEVETGDAALEEFVGKQIKRFWMNSAARALKSIEWGYSGSEVIYRVHEGQIQFDILKDFDSPDLRAITNQGTVAGMMVRNIRHQTTTSANSVYIGGPKKLWHVHGREKHPWYGQSRLFGAHVPWWEQWSDGGYRDVRRLWFYKNSFEGGIIYHPPGNVRLQTGELVPNKELAREIIDKKRTGGTMTFPNSATAEGQRQWEYLPPNPIPVPAGLLEYGDSLRLEILEGMGVPNEIIESSGDEGFGSASGRQVPEMAFYSTLQELIQWEVMDFDHQVVKPLVALNMGADKAAQYEVKALPITGSAEEQRQTEQEQQELQAEQSAELQRESLAARGAGTPTNPASKPKPKKSSSNGQRNK